MRRPARRSPPPARPRSLGFGEYRSTVARCRREYLVGCPRSLRLILLLLLGGLLVVVLLDVLALRVGLLRLGLVVVVADAASTPGRAWRRACARDDRRTKLSFSSAPRSSSSSSSESRRRLAGLRALPLRLVGAATSSRSRRPRSPRSPCRPRDRPRPRARSSAPCPPRSSALVVGGVPVDVRREAHRRGPSRRASRPGAHRVSMCIPDRTRTIPRRRCSESCAGPRARVRSWTFLNKFQVVMGNSNRGRVRLDRRVPLSRGFLSCSPLGVCVCMVKSPKNEHIQTVRFVSGK